MSLLDNAKEVANAVHEIKNLELYAKVLDLNRGIMDLVEQNRKLHAENEDLKKKFQVREKMMFKEPFYYQDGDQTPFCPACWEDKNSAIHLVFAANREDAIYWNCPVCKHHYSDKKNRGVIRTHQYEPPPVT
ncbi:MAG: hypothetical protein ACYCSP_13830 [Acidobacteriaceae bacterium]